MPAVRRSPLLLAFALALLPAAALAVVLGGRHMTTRTSPTKVALASATPHPSATPTPQPTPLPMLAVADRLDLTASRGYGRVTVTAEGAFYGLAVPSFTLATTPRDLPAELPVWKLRGFQSNDTAALALRLGVTTAARQSGAVLDAERGYIHNSGLRLFLQPTPSTGAQAQAQVDRLLQDLGIPALIGDGRIVPACGDAGTWCISYQRHALDGVPVGIEGSSAASMTVDDGGMLTELTIDEAATDGGSMYPLRDWRQAWSDVTHNRLTRICCLGPMGNPDPSAEVRPGGSRYRMHVDKVFLFYDRALDLPGAHDYYVPFYGFRDSSAGFTVAVPALRSADVQIVQPTP